MDDKGEIVSACDVDENIALQIWTKGLSPRLVVFNKKQNSRKLIHLSWLEKKDRKLSVKGKNRGESSEYTIETFVPFVQRILSEYAVYTLFRPRLWKFALELEKVLHVPEIVTEKSELILLSEEKRSSLWIADFTGDNKKEGFFFPFFPASDEERNLLEEDELRTNNNARNVDDLMKTGIIRALTQAKPSRWHSPVRLAAAAILLGFSFCDCDGSDFVDTLWRQDDKNAAPGVLQKKNSVPFTLRDPRLVGLGEKLAAFVRHFEAVKRIDFRTSMDSDKELLDMGYTRKRRIAFPEGFLGDTSYSVTFFDNESGDMALSCKAKGVTLRHKGELIYSLPLECYERALLDDSLGGEGDDFFTVAQLVRARQFKEWYERVALYLSSFAGLI